MDIDLGSLFGDAALAAVIALTWLTLYAGRVRKRISEDFWQLRFARVRKTASILYVVSLFLLALARMGERAFPQTLAECMKRLPGALLYAGLRYGLIFGLAVETLYHPLPRQKQAKKDEEKARAESPGEPNVEPEEGGSHAPNQ